MNISKELAEYFKAEQEFRAELEKRDRAWIARMAAELDAKITGVPCSNQA